MTTSQYTVVLVDDNDDHCMLIEDMLMAQGFARQVIRFPDAESALAHLLDPQAPRASEGPGRPDFVFLDIRLPGMSGIELLRQLKSHPRTRAIPTIMLTTSERSEEINASYDAGACGYIVKPVDFMVLSRKIQALRDYWRIACEAPVLDQSIPAGTEESRSA
jgi:two-component system, response regulator